MNESDEVLKVWTSDVLTSLKYNWLGYFKAFPLLAGGILAVSLLIYVVLSYGPWAKRLTVSGVVYAEDTDEPVANAKIIVTVWNRGFLESSPTEFMMLTDERGQFSIERNLSFLIREVSIIACSPDNRLAGLTATANLFERRQRPLRKGVRRYFRLTPGKGQYAMRVYEPPEEAKKEPRNQYENFRSIWAADRKFVPTHSSDRRQRMEQKE